jgi:DNA polymerase III subunit epsilon
VSVFDWFAAKPHDSNAERWIALDLETTGLDPVNDRIIEIGAVAIHRGNIELNDFFHRVLATSGEVKAENRVVHGVTAKEQYDGSATHDALDALVAWMGDAPLVGFFTEFDVKFLRTALASHLGKGKAKHFASQHIDVARIAPIVFPEMKAKSLGEWSAALRLPIHKQHRALADALATAHLFQRIISKLPENKRTFGALRSIESAQRWL